MSPASRRALTIDDPIAGRDACDVAQQGADSTASRLRDIPLGEIQPNADQPRKRFDQNSLAALADSIRQRGVLQPIIVRPVPGSGYQLVAGERRWRAARLAERQTIPALVDEATDGTDSLELALIENVAREQLTVIEEARTIALLLDDLHVTTALLARQLGRSRSDLAHTVRLLDLPDQAIELIDAGALTKGHGKALLTERDHHRRRTLARQTANAGWSVAALKAEIARGALPRRARREAHPDQQAAAGRLQDLIAKATGSDARARPHRQGYQVILDQNGAQRLAELLDGYRSESKAVPRGTLL